MNTKPSKNIHVFLWVAQALVSALLLFGAVAKLFQPIEQAAQMLPWAAENPILLRFTGVVDLLGGLGLIIPAMLKFKPALTVYAAVGTVMLMLMAIAFHVSRGEAAATPLNFVMLALALFIAWGRNKKAPIVAR